MPNDDRFLWTDLIATAQVTYRDERRSLAEQLDAAVAHCARQASRYGAKATMTLKVAFAPDGRDEMRLAVELISKLPNPAAIEVPVYINKHGELVKDDPSQLQLLELPAKKGETA